MFGFVPTFLFHLLLVLNSMNLCLFEVGMLIIGMNSTLVKIIWSLRFLLLEVKYLECWSIDWWIGRSFIWMRQWKLLRCWLWNTKRMHSGSLIWWMWYLPFHWPFFLWSFLRFFWWNFLSRLFRSPISHRFSFLWRILLLFHLLCVFPSFLRSFILLCNWWIL